VYHNVRDFYRKSGYGAFAGRRNKAYFSAETVEATKSEANRGSNAVFACSDASSSSSATPRFVEEEAHDYESIGRFQVNV